METVILSSQLWYELLWVYLTILISWVFYKSIIVKNESRKEFSQALLCLASCSLFAFLCFGLFFRLDNLNGHSLKALLLLFVIISAVIFAISGVMNRAHYSDMQQKGVKG